MPSTLNITEHKELCSIQHKIIKSKRHLFELKNFVIKEEEQQEDGDIS